MISPERVFTILIIINLLFLFSLVRTRRLAAGESWTTKIDTRVCVMFVRGVVGLRGGQNGKNEMLATAPAGKRARADHEAFIVVVDDDEKRDLQK